MNRLTQLIPRHLRRRYYRWRRRQDVPSLDVATHVQGYPAEHFTLWTVNLNGVDVRYIEHNRTRPLYVRPIHGRNYAGVELIDAHGNVWHQQVKVTA